MDIILRGGTVIDGTGAPAVCADVGITDGRVEAVGDLSDATAETVLDITGRIVAPGFIDVHTHTDWGPFLDDEHLDVKLSSARQGVTTEVCGNCGISPFPASDLVRSTLTEAYGGSAFGGSFRLFDSLAAYREELDTTPMLVNLAPLVGHGTVRGAAMGYEDRAPTGVELDVMKRLVHAAMEDGAFGVSTGLIYMPGTYATTEEIIVLAEVAAQHGRLYTTHMRNEGPRLVEALEEALRIGRESGAAVEISHHKVTGEANWGTSQQTLKMLEDARRAGMRVVADSYPYTAASTGLSAYLPRWAQDGGFQAMLARLKDDADRERIETDFAAMAPGRMGADADAMWAKVVVASCGDHDEWAGRSIFDLATEAGKRAGQMVCDILLEDSGTMIISHGMDQDEVRSIGTQPFVLVGSDGAQLPGKQHPRTAGTFTRVLGEVRRGERAGSLEDTIRRMTSASAEHFGIPDRGTVARGKVADLVVLDPATVADGATFEEPYLPPHGIDHVLLAGRFLVRDGKETGLRAGQVLAPA